MADSNTTDKPTTTYSIKLSDGTVLSDLSLNGNNYISKSEVTADTFDGKLATVEITKPDGTKETLKDQILVQVTHDDKAKEYWFVFRPLTQEEKDHAELESDTEFLAQSTLSDEQAVKKIDLFPEWDKNSHAYTAGDRVRYKGKLYKVLQAHTSQPSWTPDTANSQFVEIDDPAIEWPEWKQPTQAENAYAKGAKVTHNGKHYVSQIDANTTEPGTDERYWKEQAAA